MLKQLEGSRAVAEAVALCRPGVICAYPISPQTHIVEALGEIVASGELAPCEFINVESEFAAMSVAIGASAAGARAYTATASQGLLYMAEALFNASGLGLPIVMTVANRAIGAPINIWNDHTDSMSQRDCGWIQLFAETNQEALDLHIQAFRLAEELSLPVMVCMDGFILTHAYERVDMPTQKQVDAYLPPFEPRQVLDPNEPVSIGVGHRASDLLVGEVDGKLGRPREETPAASFDLGLDLLLRDRAEARGLLFGGLQNPLFLGLGGATSVVSRLLDFLVEAREELRGPPSLHFGIRFPRPRVL
jgi:pyruvate/2-oxoacid:ferredoxin oxidoreductase alpha subunit